MAQLPIRLYGDPALRKKARPVQGVDEELRQLAADMGETMKAASGVGLAANQVGVLRRIIVLDMQPIAGEERIETLINPAITEREGTILGEEGCLSIPEISEEIERSEKVQVTWTDGEGVERSRGFEGFGAAVIQHEIDHLDGILIVDRISTVRRNLLKGTLKRIARTAEQQV